MRGVLFALVIGAVCSTASAEDDCSTTPDLSKDLGPVFNQHCSNWCPYFTATDLMTQKLRRTGQLRPGERLHPLMVAGAKFLVNAKLPDLADKDGGSPDSAFGAVNKVINSGDRLCRETDLGSATGSDNPIFQRSADEATRAFQTGGSEFGVTCPDSTGAEPSVSSLADRLFSVTSRSWIKEFRSRCKTKAKPFYWMNDFDETRFEQLKAKEPVAAAPETITSFRKTIADSFKKGALPAILFKSNFLKDPNRVRTPEEIACGKSMADSKVGSFHWASIVARKRNAEGICEYKLRNSWGSDCAGMKEPAKCKDGYHWIPRDVLEQKMANVQYLE